MSSGEPGVGYPATFQDRLGADDWSRLQALGRPQLLPARHLVLSHGDRAAARDDLAVIRRGWVKVLVHDTDGYQALLAVRGPGDVIGETGAVSGRARSGGVRTISEVELLRLSRITFTSTLRTRPGLALALLGVLTDRVQQSDAWRLRCACWSTERRLAALLVELLTVRAPPTVADASGPLPFTQQELGGFIGTSRKSVTRALRVMRRAGLVETGHGSLTVLDLPGLLRCAETPDRRQRPHQ